jgi:hypothetical protein
MFRIKPKRAEAGILEEKNPQIPSKKEMAAKAEKIRKKM